MSIDWDSADWGKPGVNVHESDTGSDVDDRHLDGGHG